jgi:hypothetical protein
MKFSEQWSTYAFTEVAGIELKLIEHNRESKNCSFSREAKVSKKPRTLNQWKIEFLI